MAPSRAAGSYRDPFGRLFVDGERLVRGLAGPAAEGFRRAESSGWLAREVAAGRVVGYSHVALTQGTPQPQATEPWAGLPGESPFELFLEHPRLPFLTYPSEWTFDALRRAAMLHLELQLAAFEQALVFRDASAYNIAFDATKPVFLDFGSFAPYVQGTQWAGLSQFCREFLNPLLLEADTGVPFQAWLRGSPGGIEPQQLARVLPRRSWLSPRRVLLVHLQAGYQRRAGPELLERAARRRDERPLSPNAYRSMLQDMLELVRGLRLRGAASDWERYEQTKTYSDGENAAKAVAVEGAIRANQPGQVIDIGCNTGFFSRLALSAGARRVVGVESDPAALTAAVRASANLAFYPVLADLADPTPASGWLGRERASLMDRLQGDFCLSLAVIHHLVLGRNLPLEEVLRMIGGLAPRGVVEFVPCSDPMAQRLFTLRRDEVRLYDKAGFESALSAFATIRQRIPVSATGRVLYDYEVRAE